MWLFKSWSNKILWLKNVQTSDMFTVQLPPWLCTKSIHLSLQTKSKHYACSVELEWKRNSFMWYNYLNRPYLGKTRCSCDLFINTAYIKLISRSGSRALTRKSVGVLTVQWRHSRLAWLQKRRPPFFIFVNTLSTTDHAATSRHFRWDPATVDVTIRRRRTPTDYVNLNDLLPTRTAIPKHRNEAKWAKNLHVLKKHTSYYMLQ